VPVRDDAVGHARLQPQRLDEQHVAGLGALDGDWAGDDMWTGLDEIVLDAGRGDGGRVLEDMLLADAVLAEVFRGVAPLILQNALVRDRVEDDDAA
jgi:hypothetical protein